jgi:hypothetical protein
LSRVPFSTFTSATSGRALCVWYVRCVG